VVILATGQPDRLPQAPSLPRTDLPWPPARWGRSRPARSRSDEGQGVPDFSTLADRDLSGPAPGSGDVAFSTAPMTM